MGPTVDTDRMGSNLVLLAGRLQSFLGAPVVPFFPFCFGVSLLKLKTRTKVALIVKGSLGNLSRISFFVYDTTMKHLRLRFCQQGGSGFTPIGAILYIERQSEHPTIPSVQFYMQS